MKESDLTRLANYNGEKARGLVHTDEWRQRMAELQRQFDEEPWTDHVERRAGPWWRRWMRRAR